MGNVVSAILLFLVLFFFSPYNATAFDSFIGDKSEHWGSSALVCLFESLFVDAEAKLCVSRPVVTGLSGVTHMWRGHHYTVREMRDTCWQ